MIKQYEVAFVKTTGEAVFVLGFEDPSPKIGDKPLVAMVRRPVMGQDGVRHVTDTFLLPELESVDEQRERFMAENKKMLDKYGPSVKPSEEPSFLA